ncbi:MAG: hypothetical protein ABID04_00490 [Patescibacteria group bacterium]
MDLKKFDLKKAKWLVPVLAVLVIFECVLVVDKVSKRQVGNEATPSGQPTLIEELESEPRVSLMFRSPQAVAVGQPTEVQIIMTPLEKVALDGVDLVFEYDPEYLEITGTVPSSDFSLVSRNWIEPEKQRVVVSMLEMDKPEGVVFEPGQETVLLTVSVTAQKAGASSLNLVGVEDKAGTVLAENTTAKKVPFTSEELILIAN